ncbi:MAG TPA: phage major capsid protein [Solirubrobacteraceae bacterium]|nr:phage major capsid protein [Solirubrobacteraceae bacterium]
MANQIPLSGASNAAGAYLLPDAQGALLTNGLLKEAGAIELCGDARATSSRREVFPIYLGQPTASFVGEGARKPVTGAELGQATLTVKKVATIVLMTDELREDLANGDFDALVDGGVRTAIRDVIDANMVGKAAGANITTNFDNALRATTATVELANTGGDRLRLAISAAMGILEANGYGNPANMGLLLAADINQHVRDARSAADATNPVYDDADPFYGIQRAFSTNLNTISTTTAAGKIVAFLVHRPNLHLRIRRDVTVAVTNEATVNDGTSDRFLFQEDMQGLRWVTRIGFVVHDLNRAVIAITDAA